MCVKENNGSRGGGSGSEQPRFSLLDGSYHASSAQHGLAGDTDADASSTALACRAEQALQLTGEIWILSHVTLVILGPALPHPTFRVAQLLPRQTLALPPPPGHTPPVAVLCLFSL